MFHVKHILVIIEKRKKQNIKQYKLNFELLQVLSFLIHNKDESECE